MRDSKFSVLHVVQRINYPEIAKLREDFGDKYEAVTIGIIPTGRDYDQVWVDVPIHQGMLAWLMSTILTRLRIGGSNAEDIARACGTFRTKP